MNVSKQTKTVTTTTTTVTLTLDEFEARALCSLLYGRDWLKVNSPTVDNPKYTVRGVLNALCDALLDQGIRPFNTAR